MRFTWVSLVAASLVTVVVGTAISPNTGGLSNLEKKDCVCMPLDDPCVVGLPEVCCSGKCSSIGVSVPQFPNVELGKCVVSRQLPIPSV